MMRRSHRLRSVWVGWVIVLVLSFTGPDHASAQAYYHGGNGHYWTPGTFQAFWELSGNIYHEFTWDWGAGYSQAVGQQALGAGQGAFNAAHFSADLSYGAAQALSTNWWTGIPNLPNPGSWQSPGMTAFDHSCKTNGYEATYWQHAMNTVSLGVPGLLAGFAEDLDKGTNNTMQFLGASFVGAVTSAGAGAAWAAIRPYAAVAIRPLLPAQKPPLPFGGGRLPLEMIKPQAPPVLELPIEPNCPGALRFTNDSAPYRYIPSFNDAERATVSLICERIRDTFPRINPKPGKPLSADGAYWEVMLGGAKKPPRVGSWLQQETGACADGWWLLKYYLQDSKKAPTRLEYHFAYHPERNLILLHYFKKCSVCGKERN